MAAGVRKGYSGIGGQAVLEGVMMKNGEKYAVAVRKPDGDIAIEVEHYPGILKDSFIGKIPFVRGIFNFVDSMILGMRALNYSTEFYDEETVKESARDSKHVSTSSNSNAGSVITMIISFIIAIGLFVILPTYIASLFSKLMNDSLIALIEGGVRIVIFFGYIIGISLLKDIRRLYRYHGAEHKCINCLEKGRPLTVKNVMRSSRFHKRCGTSFLFLVVFISVIIFFFIRVDSIWIRFLIRIAMIPVVAGIAYEVLRLAGRYDNVFINIISAPGLLIQRITTKEPDKYMVEVAIASVEAVFDWKAYLAEAYGYEVTDESLKEDEEAGFIKIKQFDGKKSEDSAMPQDIEDISGNDVWAVEPGDEAGDGSDWVEPENGLQNGNAEYGDVKMAEASETKDSESGI